MKVLKILARTLLILAAAGLVAGGMYLYVNSSGAGLGRLPGERGRFERGARPAPGSGNQILNGLFGAGGGFEGRGGREGFERDGGSFSLAGLPGVLGQAAKVGLITVAIVGAQALVRQIRRSRRRTVNPA